MLDMLEPASARAFQRCHVSYNDQYVVINDKLGLASARAFQRCHVGYNDQYYVWCDN